jgi:hypothetical protein
MSLDLDPLREPERRAYVSVRIDGRDTYEHARSVGRSHREIQQLLAKAERKLDGGSL